MVAQSLTVVQMLPELNAGGVERGTLELGNYLSRHGHRSIVISGGGRLVPELQEQGSQHIPWPVGRKSPAVLRYVFSLRTLLKRRRIDILHIRSRVPAWAGYIAWKSLPATCRPRLVTTFHGFYSVNGYSAIMTRGERVIAISGAVADHIRERYRVPDEKIVVIYRGVDEKEFDPDRVSGHRIQQLKHHWGIGDVKAPVLMLPGRLTQWKGQDVFVESLDRIRSLNWLALCVGDLAENPSFRRRLEGQIARKALQDRVRLVGHCADMPAALMVADVVVSAASTQPEAFGRIAVEAQAMGKPVIASAHGGSLETVLDRKTGRLVKACDPAALSEALAEVVENPRLGIQWGREGRRWVREKFSVQIMCGRTLQVYFDLMADAQGSLSKRIEKDPHH